MDRHKRKGNPKSYCDGARQTRGAQAQKRFRCVPTMGSTLSLSFHDCARPAYGMPQPQLASASGFNPSMETRLAFMDNRYVTNDSEKGRPSGSFKQAKKF